MIVLLICFVFIDVLQIVICPEGKDTKIVGGKGVKDIRQMPWLVNIEMKYVGHICGGSILTPVFVLTACHCLVLQVSQDKTPSKTISADELVFISGTLFAEKRDNNDPNQQIRDAKYLLVHPQCRDENKIQVFDYGLGVLKSPFSFNAYVNAFKLLSMNKTIFQNKFDTIVKNPKAKCYVAGWGEVRRGEFGIDDEGRMSKHLRIMEMHLISDDQCRQKFGQISPKFLNFNFRNHNQICAVGSKMWGSDCQGDSGGPIVCEGFQIALVSYGFQCGISSPATYADLVPFVEWFSTKVLSYVHSRKTSTAPHGRMRLSALNCYVLIHLMIVAVSYDAG
ncbi:hypothetical protein GE061_005611 [Apolygus lucorum]|uniref:Peptidase S1 domain-containing protein n=1 Tax=Apolygus lucorum TaxID=248454 RepID=A0A8S9WY50_APOLU|nr:hypothetical protein GE061_005611 [Apolygus lucorum]